MALAVRLARGAAAELAGLPRQDRGRLIMNLMLAAWRQRRSGLITVSSWRYVAACEVSLREDVILTYAIVSFEELRSRLCGQGR